MKTIKIGQLNANGSETVMDQISRYAEENELDLLCLQEPYTRKGKIVAMPKSAQIVTQGKSPKSAVIVFNKQIKTTKITQLSDEWTICVEIKTATMSSYIVSSYFQYRHEINPYINKLKEICTLLGEENLIITADANAKSIMWHSKENDKRGEDLLNFIMEFNLTIANQPGNPPTYRNTMGGESNIDVSLLSNKLKAYSFTWTVEDGLTTSDHNIIRLTLHTTTGIEAPIEDGKLDNLKYNVNKLNWAKVERALRIPNITPDCDVNVVADIITTNIRQAIQSAVPSRTTKLPPKSNNLNNNDFWNSKLNQLRKTCRAQLKSIKKPKTH